MATITGNVILSELRALSALPSDQNLAGVSVVLQNTSTTVRVTALTDANGLFTFLNVPPGNYIVVESYGLSGGTVIADFNNAVAGSVPVGIDPPISIATSPPAGSTNIDSITPNTLKIIVAGSNITGLKFIDGPIIYTPISTLLDACATISSTNLITAANNGTFGSFAAGTAANTPLSNTIPFPGVTPDFIYTLPSFGTNFPHDGEYTVQNITNTNGHNNINDGTWWIMADHTTGDETGAFMLINASVIGAVFFTQTVNVTPNTNYILTTWLLNMIKTVGYQSPTLNVEILDQNNNILYQQNIGVAIPINPNVPEWKQIGTSLNSGNNNQLTVKLISNAPASQAGNDFSVDDVMLQPISIPTFTPVKSVDKQYAGIGDVVTYTITLPNTCTSTLSNVSFQDTIPQGLNFLGGSVIVDGATQGAFNPQTGFAVPTIPGGSSAVIKFSATVVSIPNPNPTNNSATMNYSYSPVVGGIAAPYTVPSNTVPVTVNTATVTTVKTVNKTFATVGDVLTYTVTATNSGNVPANNVVILDTLPVSVSFVPGSVTSTDTFTGTNPATGITLTNSIPVGGSSSISFKATVITIPNPGSTPNTIPNNATTNYNYTVNPATINGGSGTSPSNIVNTQVNYATLSNTKSVSPQYADIGSTLTYTLTYKNNGNVPANNVVITDTLPAGTTFVANSITSSIPFAGSDPATGLTLSAPIPAGSTETLTYQVKVGTTIPNPNPIPNTATSAYTYTINPASINGASANGITNTVLTTISNANLLAPGGFVKSVNNTLGKVGDVLTYTLVATNSGNTPANNVVIIDTIPNGTTFVPGSVTSTSAFTGSNPQTGITLTSPIQAGNSATISYQVTITTIPVPNPIVNTASISYAYTVDPANPNSVKPNGSSNPVSTTVSYVNLNFVKSVNTAFDKVGALLTYTFTITNNGNTFADNVVITDTIPSGTSFVPLSITSSLPFTGTNPATGITLTNSIPVGGKATVSYQVQVTTIPNPNPIPNTGNVNYTFTANPAQPDAGKGSLASNTVNTQINTATLASTKTVDKAFAKVGDTLTYTIISKNNGNVDANNVVIIDTLPNGLTLVPASVTATAPFTGTDPNTGITLTNPITPGNSVTVTFKAVVNSLPSPNPISNAAIAKYSFTSNPANPNANNSTSITPPAMTQVNNADLVSPGNFLKSADKTFADIGDTITYTLTIKNTGNVNANNILVTDVLPPGTTFVPGSVTSPSAFTGTNIETGITLTNPIAPNATVTVSYKAKVTTMPVPNPIVNTANINYTFTSDPAKPDGNTVNGVSGPATTTVNHADLTSPGNFVKTADKSFVNVGDIITYTITDTNTGNVPANNVVITDTIPNGTTLLPGSVVVNVASSGTNPQTGISITNPIAPNASVTMTYQVTVTTIPVPNPIPNAASVNYTYTSNPANPNGSVANGTTPIVYTEVNHADLTSPGNFIKSVDKAFANVGDILTYTLKATNSGNTPAENVVITDLIPSGTSFVAGSVVSSSLFTGNNPATGITLTNPIAPGSSASISYKVTVTTIPSTNPIPNTGNIDYNYTVDPNSPNKATGTGPSNTVNTQVNHADLTNPGNLTKVADKAIAAIGDIVTYTVTATNSGNAPANNVVITDTIPNGATFVAGSITSANAFTGTDPTSGITLTNPIPAGGSVTITYKVKVNSIPNPNPMLNVANVNYQYTVDPSIPNGANGSAVTPPAATQVNSADLTSPDNFTKTADKAFANVGDTITYTITAKNTGNVAANNVVVTDTLPVGTSFIPGSIASASAFTGTDPTSGITLTNPIPAGGSVTITYKVKVNVLPVPNPLANVANVNYTFTSDPANPNSNKASAITPPANTQVNTADLVSPGNFVKSADKAFADVGSTITYTLVVKNTGNVSADKVVITDTIPAGTSFVAGSITSTSAFTGTDLQSGITLTNPIPAGGSVTITYKVTVTTIPVVNPIPNTANVAYSFTTDPAIPDGNNANGPSNTVNTQVNHADLTSPGNFNKTVDKAFVNVGDTLTYTITDKNTGNVAANNVVITDTLPAGTVLVPGSVVVDVPSTGNNPETGINITNPIAPNATVTVTYKVTVTTIPSVNPIPNDANVNYTYTSDPAKPNGSVGNGTTPTVYAQVNHADLVSPGNFNKTVDKAFANIGDVLTYTLKVTNSGNVAANNIVVIDPIPAGTSFVAGSVVSDVAIVGTDISTGITLSNPILPGASATIAYKVTVNTIPSINPIPNTGSVNYKYTVDPANPNGASDFGPSNTVSTQVNHADLTKPGDVTKVADKAIATIGDIITYTVTATNSGNVDANNVVITDTIPSGTTFVPGSITSTSPFTGTDPNTGITLTNPIPKNSTVTITYKVKVDTVPTINPIVNVANIAYQYTVDPANPNGANANVVTPPANTQINAANLVDPGNFVKSVDKKYADVSNVLTYTFTTTNTGNVPANNVVITDPAPAGTTFIPGTITSNVLFSGTDPGAGLSLTNPINPGDIVNISFDVLVTTIPAVNPIPNKGNIKYTFTSDPANPNGNSASATAPLVTTQINHADVNSKGNLTKTSDKQSAIVGDIITYTVTATNTGNVPADKFVITDTIPTGMTFVPGSITSSVAFTGTDITTGITLTNPLLPGTSAVVTFKAKVISSNVTNPVKNTVTGNYKYTVDPSNPDGASATATATDNIGVTIYNPSLQLVKSSNKNYVVVGDTLTYTITATNNGNILLGNLPNAPIMIYDTLSPSLEFVPGSVKINGVSQPLAKLGSGINLGTLDIGKSDTITFDAVVLSNNINPITNSANSTFGIQLPGGPVELVTSNSNIVSVIPELATLDIVKTSDKNTVSLGNTITYTVTLTNSGTLDALNVIFKDILPVGTTLVDHSFTVNNNVINGVDLADGVNIGNILVSATTKISYTVKVVSSNCSMKLINSVSVNFNYMLPDREIGSTTVGPTSTSTSEVDLSITNFKQISIENNFTIPCQKPSVESINTLTGNVEILNSTVVQTTPGQSLEGQTLTNYKLVVNGVLKLLVEYTACDESQSVHSAHFNMPFSTFIILPNNYCLDSRVEIDSEIEDIYSNISNGRNLFINTTALINVKILSCGC